MKRHFFIKVSFFCYSLVLFLIPPPIPVIFIKPLFFLSKEAMKPTTNPESSPIFRHLLHYQQWYLTLLLILILAFPLGINAAHGQPLFIGPESYYHLHAVRQLSWNEPYHGALFIVQQLHPLAPVLLSPLLAVLCVWLFISIAKSISLRPIITFLCALFIIISPAAILAFDTISAQAIWLFFFLAGLWLLLKKKVNFWWSLLPFFIGSFISTFTSIITIVFLTIFVLHRKQRQLLVLPGLLFIFMPLQYFVGHQPFFLGPFTSETALSALISDLGAVSGLSFFLVLLALIGLAFTWKQRPFFPAYIFLLLIPVYVYNISLLFFLTLLNAFFAAFGLLKLLHRRWIFPSVKICAIFLLFLGLLFSTLSYLQRMPTMGPAAATSEVLSWIGKNTPADALILSSPENSEYIRYFAHREPFSSVHDPHDNSRRNITAEIFSSTYITGLFPLLEQYHLAVIYITPAMRASLPADQGFLFLLKNERFKLRYSTQGYEVWMFSEQELSP